MGGWVRRYGPRYCQAVALLLTAPALVRHYWCSAVQRASPTASAVQLPPCTLHQPARRQRSTHTHTHTDCICVYLHSYALLQACTSLVRNAAGFVAARAAIGTGLATFVSSNFWVVLMFDSSVLGAAAATCTSWGNAGSGVSLLLMPLL